MRLIAFITEGTHLAVLRERQNRTKFDMLNLPSSNIGMSMLRVEVDFSKMCSSWALLHTQP